MSRTQKAHHIGSDRSHSYPFPDTARNATPYDGFFMHYVTNIHHAFIAKSLGYFKTINL